MITVTRASSASPADVWAVLANGWTYAAWVVGASRIRAVQSEWPLPGARMFHSVGTWPLLVSDDTEVLDSVPGRSIRLKVRTRPFGQGIVEVEAKAEGAGSLIEMREDASDGLARLVPKPARQALIVPRNIESLKRLALLAERRAEPTGDASD